MTRTSVLAALLFALAVAGAQAAEEVGYKGFRVCAKCHDEQGTAWRSTAHAKALESLKPNVKSAAKTKAKLDPAKDYTQEKDCVGCHTTGVNEPGGYRIGMDPDEAKVVIGVTCEACHGAGDQYRKKHGDAGDKLKTTSETTDRQMLVEAKQNFDYEKACARCHLNYQGSPWAGAKPPYTPFTPAIDSKYAFDFNKAVRTEGSKNPAHTHYKLRGVFKGDPVPAIRADLQRNAKELEE